MMGLRSGRMPRVERRLDADGVPAGIHLAVGAVAVIAAVIVAAWLPARPLGWRLVPVAIVVFATAVTARRLWVPVAVSGLAALVVDGFVVNRLGELSWHGAADVDRLLVVAGSAGVGLLLGTLHRWRRRPPPLTVPADWIVEPDSHRPVSRMDKEEVPRVGSHLRGRDDRGVRDPRARGAGS